MSRSASPAASAIRATSEQGLAEVGYAGLELGLAECEQKLAAVGRVGAAQAALDVERLLEPAHRLVGRHLGQRRTAGAGGVVARLGPRVGAVRRGPVLGELAQGRAQPADGVFLERLGHPRVHACAPRTRELVAQRVVDQGVHEGEAPGPAWGLGHERGRRGSLEHVEGRVLVDGGDAGEHVDVELAPDDGRGAQQTLGVGAEPGDAPADDLVDALRQLERGQARRRRPAPRAVALDRARLGEVPDHLAEEERVAAGLAVELVGERGAAVVERVAGRGLEQGLGLLRAQAREREALDAGLAPQVGEQLGQRCARRPRLAVGGHHQQRHRGRRPVQVADERERRARGPVQVVEDEQDRGVGGAAVQQLDRGAEEQIALGLGVGRLG